MNEFKRAKQRYESIEIPEELEERVQAGIRQGKANRMHKKWVERIGSVAACLALLVGLLNVFPAVAASAADIPVLGGLFQLFTVRRIEAEKNQVIYHVEVPAVSSEAEIAKRVNEEIQLRVDRHLAEMEQEWEDYREAFFATGGTEEEWAQRTKDVQATYEIKSQTDTILSFVVDLSQCSYNATQTQYFYNLDLEQDRELTLKDLLGEDWIEICNATIQAQIDASVDSEGFTYFFPPEEGGFVSVDETTTFYIREDGVPVVVFPKYAIAAGAAGIVEFPIMHK